MVLVGVNVDHSQLVKLGEKHFVNPVTSWKDAQSLSLDDSISQYTGGQIHVRKPVFLIMLNHNAITGITGLIGIS